jgi:hypothetical protein
MLMSRQLADRYPIDNWISVAHIMNTTVLPLAFWLIYAPREERALLLPRPFSLVVEEWCLLGRYAVWLL